MYQSVLYLAMCTIRAATGIGARALRRWGDIGRFETQADTSDRWCGRGCISKNFLLVRSGAIENQICVQPVSSRRNQRSERMRRDKCVQRFKAVFTKRWWSLHLTVLMVALDGARLGGSSL